MAFSQENDVILIKLEGAGNPTVYVPPASDAVRGLASFDERDFIVEGGHVTIDPERVGEIIDSEFNKKVDKKTTAGLHAYTHNGSEDGEVPISIAPVEDTLVQRDNNGVIKSEEGVSNNDVVIIKQLDGMLYEPVYDPTTHKLTIKQKGKETFVMDLPLESLIRNVETVERDGKWYLVFTFDEESGHQEVEVPLTALVQDFVKTVNGKGPDENGDVYVDTLRDLKLYDALLLTDENGLPIEDEEGRYIVPEDVDVFARTQIQTLLQELNALRDYVDLLDS
jgi:hypothetical protein